MQKFMFIIREDLIRLASLSDKQRQDEIPPMLKWVEGIADGANYIEGEPLVPNGHYVRKDEVLSDGPFIESKEGVSGFMVITAESLDQATAIAQTCPLVIRGVGAVEVRPLMMVPPELQVKK
jgi:hypothetical protein